MAKKKTRRVAKKAARKRSTKHVPTRGLYGWITHTELASHDPQATRTWCAEVFGWRFRPGMQTPAGEYHLYAYSEQGGGGIRATGAGELPGSTPFVHVADAHEAYAAALRAGAQSIAPPERVMEGVTIALVRAPGGVPIGLSGP
ncbi:MAG TPA: VOC family protein [Myxococcota bacterium]|nr:VOC family protein [Myxococcota bacterium]